MFHVHNIIQMVVVVQAYEPGWAGGFSLKPHPNADPRQDLGIFSPNARGHKTSTWRWNNLMCYKVQTIRDLKYPTLCVINKCTLPFTVVWPQHRYQKMRVYKKMDCMFRSMLNILSFISQLDSK